MDYIIIAFICLMIKLCTSESTNDKIDKLDANPYNSIKSVRWENKHPKERK